ncbi:helix-turn-helix domain-containing protein [Kitasatospora sp. NBC_01302]|uniref:helix-turn-helix domain-containing protein n=1 Tax=Kitasatospora sp. NBC_01302 TaxID=2903575 RepID=UPI002E1002A9|nr:helix-turn-helix domain-containing protein [Kitasatospora sp. NBC_01302]
MLYLSLSTDADKDSETLVPPPRWRIADCELMRRLMARAPGGRSLHVRDLAREVGLSRSKVSALLTGERPLLDETKAHLISEALGVHAGAIFDQPQSPSTDEDF